MGLNEDGPKILRALNVSDASAAFLLGEAGTTQSSAAHFLLLYGYWYAMFHLVYYVFGIVFSVTAHFKAPHLPSQQMSRRAVLAHIATAERSFPLLTFIGVISESLRVHRLSWTCESVEACGGWGRSISLSIAWFFIAELLAYLNHVHVLHGIEFLKPLIHHEIHHEPKKATEMTFWSGYTFSGMDGTFQSLPLILAQVVFPAPASFVKAYTLGVSVWTMYIHGGADLGWPFLGACSTELAACARRAAVWSAPRDQSRCCAGASRVDPSYTRPTFFLLRP